MHAWKLFLKYDRFTTITSYVRVVTIFLRYDTVPKCVRVCTCSSCTRTAWIPQRVLVNKSQISQSVLVGPTKCSGLSVDDEIRVLTRPFQLGIDLPRSRPQSGYVGSDIHCAYLTLAADLYSLSWLTTRTIHPYITFSDRKTTFIRGSQACQIGFFFSEEHITGRERAKLKVSWESWIFVTKGHFGANLTSGSESKAFGISFCPL